MKIIGEVMLVAILTFFVFMLLAMIFDGGSYDLVFMSLPIGFGLLITLAILVNKKKEKIFFRDLIIAVILASFFYALIVLIKR